ncbi:MAG TPA: DUF5659 domain-containing protein [Actinomycetota bacterium]|nr:DUF5659 domain-containing protein [Actinomycetota bacterium]
MSESLRRTEDLTLAATLCTLGHELKGIESNGSSRVMFCFEDSAEVRADVTKFRAGQCRVEPQQLAATIRTLRGAAREETTPPMKRHVHERPPR